MMRIKKENNVIYKCFLSVFFVAAIIGFSAKRNIFKSNDKYSSSSFTIRNDIETLGRYDFE